MCTHCGETGHTKARCYDLIGYPDWWDPAKAPRKRNSKPNHNHQASVAVTKPSNDVAEASSLIATSGNIGKVFHISASDSSSSTWIIDSGATDHMTFDSQHVPSMKQSTTHIVSTTNGNPSPVIGECSIPLLDNLNLDSVLVVPSLNHNLLSVTQITSALYCVVIF